MTTDAPGLPLSDLNPAQRIAYVEHQIYEARAGRLDFLECPYCRHITVNGEESLCCESMGEAVAAVLFKIECQEQLDQVARIAEGADRQVSLVVN